MKSVRVIARLDIKNEYVVKGIQLEGLRKIGNPNEMAKRYYEGGIDEIILMDVVASYYDRNSMKQILTQACKDVFVPIAVGGGVRSIEGVQEILDCGADKVAINTQAVKTPELIRQASAIFGSQCIIASIDAKKMGENNWVVYTDNGREQTNMCAIEWAKTVEGLGAGEILLTSIDSDGTKKGFDCKLVEQIVQAVNIPVIASGGAGTLEHIASVLQIQELDAISLGSALHYGAMDIATIKQHIQRCGMSTRL